MKFSAIGVIIISVICRSIYENGDQNTEKGQKCKELEEGTKESRKPKKEPTEISRNDTEAIIQSLLS
jgi:hypothetical protein